MARGSSMIFSGSVSLWCSTSHGSRDIFSNEKQLVGSILRLIDAQRNDLFSLEG